MGAAVLPFAVRREPAVPDRSGAGPCVSPLKGCSEVYPLVCPRSAVSAGVTGVRSRDRGATSSRVRRTAGGGRTVSARRSDSGPGDDACRRAAFHPRDPGSCGRRRLEGATVKIPLPVVLVVAPVGEAVIGEGADAPSGIAALLMGAAGNGQKKQEGEERLLLHVRDTTEGKDNLKSAVRP